jgi:sensor histidine kinase YesM
MNKKQIAIIAIHIGYWFLYLASSAPIYMLLAFSDEHLRSNPADGLPKWIMIMIPFAIIPGITGFYGGYSILYPKFLSQRKLGKYFLFTLPVALVSITVSTIALQVMFPSSTISFFEADGYPLIAGIIGIMTMINLTIGTVIKGFITSYQDIQLKEELTRRNTSIELALVRSKINPHFLFNTLNNIDVLIKQKPDDASLYLNKLSGILRFMLYETKEDEVPLALELENVRRFVELQQIRTSVKNYAVIHVDGNPDSFFVHPMIFLPFIENAFKYAEHNKQPEAIKLSWRISNDELFFRCENLYSVEQHQHHARKESGIGNELIRKRIELLYPGRHHLNSGYFGDRFIVELKIWNK